MAARYQHITTTIRRDVTQRVGGLLWEPTGDPSPEPPMVTQLRAQRPKCNHYPERTPRNDHSIQH
jgi:hypothetical protein